MFNGNGFDKAIESATKLGAKLSRVEKLTAASASSISQGVGKMGLEWEAAGSRIERTGKKVADLGDNLTRSVTLPMLGAGAYAGKMAVDFDTALANVRKTSNLTESQLDKLADSALELSKTQPVSAETILNVEALGAQLGISNESLESFAKTVTGLDIATNMDAETAATEMARFANIVGMADEEFGNYGSTLVAIGNNMATTESEVSQMAMRFASAGAQAGLSEAQILGMSAAMSSLGIKAEMGGSALSQVFVSIGKAVSSGGDELDAFASRAGMSAEQFRAAWQDDAAGAFNALIEGIGGATDAGEDMNAIMSELGFTQIRQSDVMRRLAGSTEAVTGKESVLASALKLSTEAWEQNTALQAEVDQRNESMASKLQVLKNRLDEVAITVGTPLVDATIAALDALDPVITAVSDAAHAFSEMDEAGQRNILMWAGVAAAAGPVLSVTGRAVQGIGHLVKAFGETASKVAVFTDAMNGLDGANLRTYASSKSLASSLGLSRNAAVQAAGGVDKYVGAWDAMNAAAKTVMKNERDIDDLMAEAERSTGESRISILKRASALESETIAVEESYRQNAKLVTAYGDSSREAEKAASGIKRLEPALEDVKSSAADSSVVLVEHSRSLGKSESASKSLGSTLRDTLSGGAKLAAASIKDFLVASAPMLALTAAVTVIGAIASKFEEMAEHERTVASATRSFNELMAEAGANGAKAAEGIESAGRSIREIKGAAEDSLSGIASFNDEVVSSFSEVYARRAELDSYVAAIEELGNKSGLTAGEQAKLAAAVDGYNSVTGEQLRVIDPVNGKIQDQSGVILENTDKLKANADAWKRRAEMAAAQDLLTEAYKNQYEAQKTLDEAEAKYNDKVDFYVKNITGMTRAKAEELALTTDVGKAYTDAKTSVDGYATEIEGLTAKTIVASSALSEDLKTAVEQLPTALQEAGVDAASKLAEGIEAGALGAKQAASFLSEDVLGAVSKLPEALQPKGMEAVTALAAGISSGNVSVEDAARFMSDSVSAVLSDMPVGMRVKGMEAVTALAAEISGGQVTVGQASEMLKTAANGGVTTLPADMGQTARDAVNNLNAAIVEGQPQTLNAATGLKDNANLGVSSLPGDMHGTGSKSGADLAAAMAANAAGVLTSSKQLSTSAENGVSQLPGKMGKAGDESSSKFAAGIEGGEGKTSDAAGKIAAAAGKMDNVGDMSTSGRHLVENFASGISGAARSVVNAATDIANRVASILGFSVPEEGPWSGAERGGERSGTHFAQNWARGMEKGAPLVRDASIELARSIPPAPGLGASRLPAEGRAATGVVNNYSLHIDGARSASMTRGQERLVAEIFDEFGLAFDMGVI